MSKILIIDDEENIRRSLTSALERRNHQVVSAASVTEGSRRFGDGFDLILLDVLLPDGSGIDLLKEIKTSEPNQVVVMISGHADVEIAVSAIREGAYDFIEKPISLDRLLVTIDNADRTDQLLTETKRLSTQLYGEFVGKSPAIKRLVEQIERSAPKASRFLVLGENGTGKELIANLVHSRSRFAEGPFVAVNCAALPSELVESELFGHTKGAFTGATANRKGRFVEANRGSIFLDEISEMPPGAQAKILRVIETREVTAVGSDKSTTVELNVIAASNKDLLKMTQDGSFREDLYYRLNVVELHLPPLRDRHQDISPLCDYFLKRFAEEAKNKPKKMGSEAVKLLSRYAFPGNVRELRNLMERVNIYSDDDRISEEAIRLLLPATGPADSLPLKEAVSKFEYDYINAAVSRNGGNVAETARQLGIERSLLYKKIKRHESS